MDTIKMTFNITEKPDANFIEFNTCLRNCDNYAFTVADPGFPMGRGAPTPKVIVKPIIMAI